MDRWRKRWTESNSYGPGPMGGLLTGPIMWSPSSFPLSFFSPYSFHLSPPSLFLALFSKNKKLQKNPLLDHPPPPPCLPKEAKISPMDHRLPGLQAMIISSQPLRAGTSPRREGTGILLVSTWRTKGLQSHFLSAITTMCWSFLGIWISLGRPKFISRAACFMGSLSLLLLAHAL